jgi:lipoprotein-anchoring transpeptidase ErfK/SrfK
MARHRDARGSSTGRRATPSTRPRYKRLGAAVGAVAVTLVAVLGGMGVLPSDQGSAVAASRVPGHGDTRPDPAAQGGLALSDATSTAGTRGDQASGKVIAPTLPANSGTGRRIVFAIGAQRVWLVDGSQDVVRRTYLVSGSVTDNLHPGTYSVYSKSMDAVGVDDSGTMKYMVRFTQGVNAAIGFHDIPVLDGTQVQSRDELGTPQSHGCIRQWRPDARALWEFAPVGTKVVVVA